MFVIFVPLFFGGERKRCNIAVEMVRDPAAIFLDEPTSGLDSFQAQNVMGALRDLARNGRTVVCTIHQPRSSIFAMFDQLMLLTDGRLAGSSTQSRTLLIRKPLNRVPAPLCLSWG